MRTIESTVITVIIGIAVSENVICRMAIISLQETHAAIGYFGY